LGSSQSCRSAPRYQRADPVRLAEGVFADSVDHFDQVAPQSAAQLRRASTHWLRHTGTHSLAAGTLLDVEMKVTGHASMSTTSKYAHAETHRRLQGSAGFLAQQTPIALGDRAVTDTGERQPGRACRLSRAKVLVV
jgi:hypothetical protein